MERIIYIKMDLALNNLQRLICHKTKQTKPNKEHVAIGHLWYFFSWASTSFHVTKSLNPFFIEIAVCTVALLNDKYALISQSV